MPAVLDGQAALRIERNAARSRMPSLRRLGPRRVTENGVKSSRREDWMANHEPLAILKQGVTAWNSWRASNPSFMYLGGRTYSQRSFVRRYSATSISRGPWDLSLVSITAPAQSISRHRGTSPGTRLGGAAHWHSHRPRADFISIRNSTREVTLFSVLRNVCRTFSSPSLLTC